MNAKVRHLLNRYLPLMISSRFWVPLEQSFKSIIHYRGIEVDPRRFYAVTGGPPHSHQMLNSHSVVSFRSYARLQVERQHNDTSIPTKYTTLN